LLIICGNVTKNQEVLQQENRLSVNNLNYTNLKENGVLNGMVNFGFKGGAAGTMNKSAAEN